MSSPSHKYPTLQNSKRIQFRKTRKQINDAIMLSDLDYSTSALRYNYNRVQDSERIGSNRALFGETSNDNYKVSPNGQVPPNLGTSSNALFEKASDDEGHQNAEDLTVNLEFSTSRSVEESDSEDEEINEERVEQSSDIFLKNWSLKHNITHSALTELLKWFKCKPDISGLPISARAFLNTPSCIDIEKQGYGEFFYFGLTNTLKHVINDNPNLNELYLDFGIDGLPLHKSTNISFWPIICKVHDLNISTVFSVAIFCGRTKPPLQDFFSKFVQELSYFKEQGITQNGRKVDIKIRSFCCDTPARSFVKNVKAHNGYNGCDRCSVRGDYSNGRMRFLNLNEPRRTDESFKLKLDENHHKEPNSPLEILNIGMVSQFPVDYMHCVCLGVMRKLLFQWRNGSRLYRIDTREFDAYMMHIKNYWPVEFNRKPRSILELERWKATELRQFLLYIGPVVLKNMIPYHVYANFMLLKYAVTILLSAELNEKYNEYARSLLEIFVSHSVQIYGKDFCVYNTHALIHLADDAKKFGSLDTVSCFPFENHLQKVKKMLRKSNMPLQQVVRRVYEKTSVVPTSSIKEPIYMFIGKAYSLEHSEENIQIIRKYSNTNFYKKLQFAEKHFTMSNKCGDNIVMLKCGQIIQCYFFFKHNKNIMILGRKCQKISSFSDYPADSSVLSMFTIKICKNELLLDYSMNDVMYKGVIIPLNDEKMVFLPLLHLL